ncbi:GcrA cell cycle regulator [Tistlia consotensis]|uniref:GcrA cell cycle regulator n=1 Tax=Tistlia consotensis USBA 355 TaxID=560819 RepID=A0A1Y6CR24_9PROT|nr:GcrA family cell cycle regulator [Tistlia consotensis]SMF82937.1 GcrA cell cycle regulator [Tistlia consotensis USBA 355]SNS31416.1 GcrA cell cycle regulator [Tistlia consotensis]
MTDQTWTPERLDLLRKRWLEGRSCSAIAGELGVTKNAVVGKAHRLKLPAWKDPIVRGMPPKPKRGLPVLYVPPVEPGPEPVELFPREREPRTCQWPFAGGCDAPREHRRPYCTRHCCLAYVGRTGRAA